MDYCLHNLPEKIYGGAVCGNGFTEPGEDCDCGLPQVTSALQRFMNRLIIYYWLIQ